VNFKNTNDNLPTVATTTPICDETPKSIADTVKSQKVNGNPVTNTNEFPATFTAENKDKVDFVTELKEFTSVTRIQMSSPSEDPDDIWLLKVQDKDVGLKEKQGVGLSF